MATYITLLRWTQRGAERLKDSPKRLDAGRKAFKKIGAEIKDVYMTMGRYDLVCVIEAPDDEDCCPRAAFARSPGQHSKRDAKSIHRR